MSDETRRRLEEAGARPVPPMDPAAADALEARLLAVARSAPGPGAPEPQPGGRRSRGGGPGRWLVLAGTALGALVLVLAIGLGLGRTPAAPELAEPVNVEVALADGTTLEDPDGLRLPEGAVVTVGEGGSARIGDLVLGPGDVATIEGGLVQVQHAPPVGGVPDPTAGTSLATPTPARPSASPRDPSPGAGTPSPSPRPTARPTPEPTRSPAPDRTPEPTRDPTPEPPRATPRPTDPPPTATPAPEPVPPRLRARAVGESTVAVTWTRTLGARTYVLLATGSRDGPAVDPVYPGSRVLGEYARPPETPLRFRVPDGVGEVRLLVVALRRDGTEIARSRVVTVATAP